MIQTLQSAARKNRFLNRLKNTFLLTKGEFVSYCYSCIGFLKVKLFFRRGKVNKLEFGVGESKKKSGFITTDLSLKTDYPFDLRMGLPFPDNSIDLLYSEHVLEHFSFRELRFLLSDCLRVLRPGASLYFVVPNVKYYVEGYLQPQTFDQQIFCPGDTGLPMKSSVDILNYIFYLGGQHHHMYDENSILTLLKEIGFSDAQLRPFDPELDQEWRRPMSIYGIAVK